MYVATNYPKNVKTAAGATPINSRPGPWRNEPDRVEWLSEKFGYPCLIKRVEHGGHLCGYVGVPPDHPCHGEDYDEDYDEVEFEDVVHGGLTYADNDTEGPSELWWFGFDCAHAGDLMPLANQGSTSMGWLPDFGSPGGVYRDCEFVRQEVERLAKAIHEAEVAP